jgi:hypothetical protein
MSVSEAESERSAEGNRVTGTNKISRLMAAFFV